MSASGWLFKKKSITMHDNMNVRVYVWLLESLFINISEIAPDSYADTSNVIVR
jgi:hypothetical protein